MKPRTCSREAAGALVSIISNNIFYRFFLISGLGSLAFRNETEAQALRAVLPKHLEDLDSLAGYYEHIAKLFEEDSQYTLATAFYKLAIESAEDPRMNADLWYNVFRGQLLADEYEAAYMSLMAMTDPEL
jgi:hypothetical protein